MSARDCFTSKIAKGSVSRRAGGALLDLIDETRADFARKEGESAASLRRADAAASEVALGEAKRRADIVNRTIAAQSNILDQVANVNVRLDGLKAEGKAPLDLKAETHTGTYAALSAFLDSDPHELAGYNSVTKLAKDIAGRAHATMADTIARMRSKMLGFKDEKILELDMLRAAFGRTDVPGPARVDADAWFATEKPMAGRYIEAGGALAQRERYFPNPTVNAAKARAIGEDGFKQLVRDSVDRAQVTDFATGKPMTDVRFEQLVNDAWTSIDAGGEGPISAFRGKTILANSRDAPRLFVMRDADAWMHYAETVGNHTSPYVAMMEHIHDMARDIAMLEKLGPNPDATLRFMSDILDREPGHLAVREGDMEKGGLKGAVRANEKIASRAAVEKKSLENLYADVSGANRQPVSTEIARRAADARSLLVGAQLGSAMISSLNDPATLAMAARMAGLDVTNVLHWATVMLTEKNSEVFAAQTGMIMDTLAHTARAADTVMGDTVRTGVAAKIGGAVIRASGLRKWTESLKGGFWLGAIAQVAHDRHLPFKDLDKTFRAALARADIGEAEWKIYAAAPVYEPRKNALFLRPQDVASLGGKEAQAASEKLAQYVNTFMDYAVIEATPRMRAMIIGDSKPGTISGELRRSLGMYRFFAGGLIYNHGARAMARGWDGSRMGHAALSFATITMLGALSMQAKEVAAGRDPIALNRWDAWGKAIIQGGGLGVFGDIIAVDQTKYGNTWASTFAGPVAGAAESILGDFALKNIRLASQGKETHFLGDALYTAARYAPGNSLWYGKLAFQRSVVDQLAKWADPRAPERFARMEETARKDWGQSYWSRPGRAPERGPDVSVMFGR